MVSYLVEVVVTFSTVSVTTLVTGASEMVVMVRAVVVVKSSPAPWVFTTVVETMLWAQPTVVVRHHQQ